MRIVGGNLRGRNLAVPKSNAIRPTTDRTRESLFNILNHKWPEKLNHSHVLDVFAGTGALGLEALSRGAAFAMFIDNSPESRGLLRTNIESFGLTGVTKISKSDATKPGLIRNLRPFDLIFVDPPYGHQLGEVAIDALAQSGWIADGAILVLEERKDALPLTLNGFDTIETRTFGDSAIGFFLFHANVNQQL